MTIFRKANNGELKQESGLQQLFQSVSLEIDVAETGVKGAKDFFEAQVIFQNLLIWPIHISKTNFNLKLKALKQSSSNNFAKEILEEQEERRRMEELKKKKRDEFMAKKSIFNQ